MDFKNAEKQLKGSWVCKDYPSAIYNFNDNGKGFYSFAGADMPFCYEDKGESVSILYIGNTVASEYKYRIEDDKLLINDSLGSTVIYIKK